MEPSEPVRILLVDDNEPFRRFVSTVLRKMPNLQVIGEEQDGFGAVRQSGALQPDVILLDIGLPGINGFEAARKIREVAAKAKIVFLTQESSPELVDEAFRLGARGYVVKAQAGSELLAAVEVVSRGARFASKGLNGHHGTFELSGDSGKRPATAVERAKSESKVSR